MVSVVQGTSNLHRLVPFYCFCLSWNFFIFRFLLSPSVCVSHFVFDSQGHIINSQIFPATSSSSSRLFPLGGSSAYLSFIDFKICRPTDLNIKQAAGVSVCVCVFLSEFWLQRYPIPPLCLHSTGFLYPLIPLLSLLSVCFHYQPPPLTLSLLSPLCFQAFFTWTNSTPLAAPLAPSAT